MLLDPNTGDNLQLIQIKCGGQFTVGVAKNGQVVSWGANGYGQLGHGDYKQRSIPTKVEALDGLVITKISCGYTHAAALTDEGEIFTWYVVRYGLYDDS